MQKTLLTICTVAVTAMLFSSCGNNATNQPSTANDSPSNEVTIGNQIWMTKNLNVDKFRNGEPIPEAKTEGEWKAYSDAGEAAWCYYDNDSANGEKYGKLYNRYAVNDPRGLAPVGYHISTDEEWTILTDHLGGESKAGARMKSKNGWYDNGNGTNSSGFSGLPGGYRYPNGTFSSIGYFGIWLSSTEDFPGFSWFRFLGYEDGIVRRTNVGQAEGFSVRCLKD
jgi:uncharacterized protein (TIGR02145 family)